MSSESRWPHRFRIRVARPVAVLTIETTTVSVIGALKISRVKAKTYMHASSMLEVCLNNGWLAQLMPRRKRVTLC
jgi:hypothetical protein